VYPTQGNIPAYGRCHGPGQSAAGAGETGEVLEHANLGKRKMTQGSVTASGFRRAENKGTEKKTGADQKDHTLRRHLRLDLHGQGFHFFRFLEAFDREALMKGFLDFGPVEHDQGPYPYWQADYATRTDTGNHGQNGCHNGQIPLLELFHLKGGINDEGSNNKSHNRAAQPYDALKEIVVPVDLSPLPEGTDAQADARHNEHKRGENGTDNAGYQ